MLINCKLINLKLRETVLCRPEFIFIVTASMPHCKGNLTQLTTTDIFILWHVFVSR